MMGCTARWKPFCLFLLLTLLLSGCASMSRTGPVVPGEGGADGVTQGDPYVRLIPAPPQSGVNEVGLVEGFLTALGSFEDDYQAARAYLAPEQEQEWQPNGTALVYNDDAMRGLELLEGDEADGTASVSMSTEQVATRTSDGRYVPAEPGEEIDATFRLRQVDGEWRIAELPDEIVLSDRDVDRVYRALNLYYYNADSSALVPETVLVPGHATTDLAMELARKLVAGPTRWLEPAVHTAFPEEMSVHTAYRSGVLTLELSSEVAEADPEERYLMAAQAAWTLKQIPGVQELRLRAGGEDLELPGVPSGPFSPTSDDWERVSPNGISEDLSAWFLQDGRLWRLGEEQEEIPAPGVAGANAPLEQQAVSLDESRVAGISAGGTEVVVADLAGGSDYEEVLSGGTYSALSWDGYGHLWVVEVPEPDGADDEDGAEPGPARLWRLGEGTDPVEVATPDLEAEEVGTVTRLRAARDGARIALLTEEDDGETTHLLLGRVTGQGGEPAVDGFIPLATDLERVRDLAWRGADQLAVLGEDERDSLHVYLVPTGGTTGSTNAGAAAGAEMETIAAAPHQPLLTGVDDGFVWLTNDRLTWDSLVPGANPVYPG